MTYYQEYIKYKNRYNQYGSSLSGHIITPESFQEIDVGTHPQLHLSRLIRGASYDEISKKLGYPPNAQFDITENLDGKPLACCVLERLKNLNPNYREIYNILIFLFRNIRFPTRIYPSIIEYINITLDCSLDYMRENEDYITPYTPYTEADYETLVRLERFFHEKNPILELLLSYNRNNSIIVLERILQSIGRYKNDYRIIELLIKKYNDIIGPILSEKLNSKLNINMFNPHNFTEKLDYFIGLGLNTNNINIRKKLLDKLIDLFYSGRTEEVIYYYLDKRIFTSDEIINYLQSSIDPERSFKEKLQLIDPTFLDRIRSYNINRQ